MRGRCREAPPQGGHAAAAEVGDQKAGAEDRHGREDEEDGRDAAVFRHGLKEKEDHPGSGNCPPVCRWGRSLALERGVSAALESTSILGLSPPCRPVTQAARLCIPTLSSPHPWCTVDCYELKGTVLHWRKSRNVRRALLLPPVASCARGSG